MRRSIRGWLLVGVLAANAMGQGPARGYGYAPPRGLVPTATVAVRIAEAVLGPIYGEAHIRAERPFRATLAKGVWTVQGSLKEGWVGGVAVVRLARRDGRILYVSHGK